MKEKLFAAIGELFASSGKADTPAFPRSSEEFNRRYAIWLRNKTEKSANTPAYAPQIDVIAQKGVPQDALTNQSYPNFRLIREGEAVEGEYLTYLFEGDRLSSDALSCLCGGIGGLYGRADLIYADEDRYEKETRKDPLFKTNLNEIDLLSFDCIGRPLLVRRDLYEKAGPMKGWSDGEAYAFALRCAAYCTRPVHVGRILLSRRKAWDINPAEGRAAIDAYLKIRSQDGYAVNGESANTFRVRGNVKGKERVAMIVPNKNGLSALRRLLESLEQNALYPEYRILIIDHGTEDLETLRYYELLRSNGAAEIIRGGVDNTAALWNIGAKKARCPFLLFLRTGAEIQTPGFVTQMAEYARRRNAGAVGCRCVDAQGKPLPEGTVSRDLFENVPWLEKSVRATSILRGECLMLSSEVFFNAGAFDETLDAAGSAAELCIRLQRRGRSNISIGNLRVCVRSEGRGASDKEKLRLYDTLRPFIYGDPSFSGDWSAVWNAEKNRGKGREPR